MARISHLDVGDRWTPQAVWTVGTTNTDPNQIVVKQVDASGAETTITTASSPSALTSASQPLARLSAGTFRLNPGIAMTQVGYWHVRFEGTGAAEASEDYIAIVDPTPFAVGGLGLSTRALVALDETKDWLQQQDINTGEDLELVRVINDVSDRIHYEAEREFKPIATGSETRNFDICEWTRCVWVGDLATLSTASNAVTVYGPDWTTQVATVSGTAVSTYPLRRQSWQPINQIELPISALALLPGWRVAITGTWGFPSVPGNIRQAALDSIASIMDRDVEQWRQDLGPTAGQAEAGGVVVVGQAQPLVLSLPPSAWATVRSYRFAHVG